MHACLWGKYLNKLKKFMPWSLVSLNLQYYNHSLLSNNHSQVTHSFPWEAHSGVTFLGQSFSLYLRKLQISLCCFICQCSTCILLQNDNFIRITFLGRLLSGGWQYSHANESNTATVKDKNCLVATNMNTDLFVFIKLKFLGISDSSQSLTPQVVITLSEKKKQLVTAAPEFISISIFE